MPPSPTRRTIWYLPSIVPAAVGQAPPPPSCPIRWGQNKAEPYTSKAGLTAMARRGLTDERRTRRLLGNLHAGGAKDPGGEPTRADVVLTRGDQPAQRLDPRRRVHRRVRGVGSREGGTTGRGAVGVAHALQPRRM